MVHLCIWRLPRPSWTLLYVLGVFIPWCDIRKLLVCYLCWGYSIWQNVTNWTDQGRSKKGSQYQGLEEEEIKFCALVSLRRYLFVRIC